MDGGVTRSLYIGRDKTSEVLKRREAVERELQAKREAKIRDQSERMARAAQLKEIELRDRMRQRNQRDLERQKALLDRRCAQMEQLNARKTELLKRAHQSASRIATLNQAKKPIYAFGSSTPRELAFLESLKQQQRVNGPRGSPVSVRGSTPSLAQGPSNTAPTTSRFQNRPTDGLLIGAPAMTRSVFGTLENGIGTTPNRQKSWNKQSNQPNLKQTPSSIKKQRKMVVEGMAAKQLNNATMTQSLYAQSSPRVTAAKANVEKVPAAKPTPTKRLMQTKPPSNNKPNIWANNASNVQKTKTAAEQRPLPVIRPKKAQQNQPSPAKEDYGIIGPVANAGQVQAMIPEQLSQEEITLIAPSHGDDKEQFGNGMCGESNRRGEGERLPAAANIEMDQPTPQEAALVEEPVQGEENDDKKMPAANTQITLFDELHHDTTNGHDGNEKQSDKKESLSYDASNISYNTVPENFSATETEKKESFSFDATATITSYNTVPENSSSDEVSLLEHAPLAESEPVIMSPPSTTPPPVLIALPSQGDIEERRRRINEILALTRQEGGGLPNAASNGTKNVNSGSSAPFVPLSLPTLASNSLLPKRDGSALAQDILAKHGRKFQKQQKDSEMTATDNSQPNFLSKQQPTDNANALAERTFHMETTRADKEQFALPGEVLSATADQFTRATSMTIFSKNAEERDEHVLLKQHQSPPDDPSTNGHKINGKEFHPPEPTANAPQTS